MKEKKNVMSLVDLETGQVFENVTTVITEKQESYFNHNRKMSKINKEFVDEYGNFIFKLNSKSIAKKDKNISNADMAKLIYCATFVDYESILKFDSGKIILKSDLKELIGVTNKSFYPWYNSMLKLKVLIENEDKSISINKNYCIKGRLNKKKDYNRIFINAIRTVYEDNKGKNMSTLGHILRLLPFVSFKSNVLCWNPKEMDDNLIDAITVGQLLDRLEEYEGDYKKFANKMSKFRIADGQPIMIFFNDSEHGIDNHIMFNPLLTYSGKNEDLPNIHKLFLILRKKEDVKNNRAKRLK